MFPPEDFLQFLSAVEKDALEAEANAFGRMAQDRERGLETPGDVHYSLGSAQAVLDLIASVRRWLEVA